MCASDLGKALGQFKQPEGMNGKRDSGEEEESGH
jgi:hypothetical protein